MSLTFTILGCGSSMGVPRVALGWGSCDPNNPKNRRRRCALLVERTGPAGRTRVLVDCTPDLREQLLEAQVDWLDGVLITHEHADHTHGIDDLRPLFVHKRRKVDVYLDEPTSRSMHARFGYCFMTPPGSEYPPILTEHRLLPGQAVNIDGQGGPISRPSASASALWPIPPISRACRSPAWPPWPASTSGSWTPCARRRIQAISTLMRRWIGSRG
jgi:phosphoribosyl 1,2-cyclic phosphate phosphodiesterase